MRLIDLDQTIFVPIVDETRGGVEYEMEMTVGEFFEKFLGGFKPQIVDAVPVEWIFEQMQILYELHNKNERVLQWLMELWHKEQEERT